ALAEGAVAGAAAAGGAVRGAVVRERDRWRAFAARLDAAHGVRGGWVRWLRDDTVVCRCEETTYGRLREVGELTGSRATRSVKLTSRAGLGPCQARVCGRTLEELVGEHGAEHGTDRRTVVVPVRLGDLAAPPSSPPHHPDPATSGDHP
ncbi:pyridine nucleotide-disulfide oxidoreductase, partial [Promicromonospora citrea]